MASPHPQPREDSPAGQAMAKAGVVSYVHGQAQEALWEKLE